MKLLPSSDPCRMLNLGVFLLFAGSLAVFLLHTVVAFSHLLVPIPNYFGNARSPYSDALAPWTQGTVSYYVFDLPAHFLYRPTAGLFFSTILSVFQSLAAIPEFFFAVFLGALGWLFLGGSLRARVILSGLLAVLTIHYDELVLPLNPECIMVDFWALSFCLIGLCLIGFSFGVKHRMWLPAAVGFLVLGIGAAVRGPQLLGGGLVLLWCVLRWLKRREWAAIAVSIIAFLAPTMGDSAIRTRYKAVSNAILIIYYVYTEPGHSWAPTSDEHYYKENLSDREVVRRYTHFMLSSEGMTFLRQATNFAPAHDAGLLKRPALLALLLVCAALAWQAARHRSESFPDEESVPGRPAWQKWIYRLCLAGLLLAAWQIATKSAPQFPHPLLVAAALIAVAGTIKPRPLAVCFSLAYLGSTTMHAALGLVGAYRVSTTYEAFVFAALVCFLVERPTPDSGEVASGRHLPRLCLILTALVALCYTGNFLVRRGQKRELREELVKANHVMKVSNDPALDRSLYLDGKLVYFYTRYDSLPFGTLRTYASMQTPGGLYHGSLIRPCVVTWDEKSPAGPSVR